jgi:protease II
VLDVGALAATHPHQYQLDVRGGHEKGERWYAEGRVLNKRNTFTDFIAATELLIAV